MSLSSQVKLQIETVSAEVVCIWTGCLRPNCSKLRPSQHSYCSLRVESIDFKVDKEDEIWLCKSRYLAILWGFTISTTSSAVTPRKYGSPIGCMLFQPVPHECLGCPTASRKERGLRVPGLHKYSWTDYPSFKITDTLYVMFYWLHFWYTNQWGLLYLSNLESYPTYYIKMSSCLGIVNFSLVHVVFYFILLWNIYI